MKARRSESPLKVLSGVRLCGISGEVWGPVGSYDTILKLLVPPMILESALR